MANKTISMDLMNQIKLLNGLGYGIKTIARDLGMSKNTVQKYLTDSEDTPEDRSICQKDSLIGFFPYCRKELSRKTLKMKEVEKIAYERDGVKYITFEVAKLREPDKFGRAFTCYYSKRVDQNEEPAPKKNGKKSKKEKSETVLF